MQRASRPDAAFARLPLREDQMPQPLLTEVKRVLPDTEQVKANPRARSAVLRTAKRTTTPITASGWRR